MSPWIRRALPACLCLLALGTALPAAAQNDVNPSGLNLLEQVAGAARPDNISQHTDGRLPHHGHFPRPRHPGNDHLLHPHHRRAGFPAPSHGHPTDPAQPSARRARPLSHLLRHDPHLSRSQRKSPSALPQQRTHPTRSPRRSPQAHTRFHVSAKPATTTSAPSSLLAKSPRPPPPTTYPPPSSYPPSSSANSPPPSGWDS